ncbi:MAG: riboflavin synthase [Myxococcota bacterium]
MFTGLVEDVGEVAAAERRAGSLRLTIRTRLPVGEMALGDSVAVDGACYTVVAQGDSRFSVDVGPESLERTVAGAYVVGTRVNLERALQVGARLGGHYVLGHVDAVGTIRSVQPRGDAVDYAVAAAEEVLDLTVPKGSVTIDGISLTVNAVHDGAFHVSIIPHTQEHTSLRGKAVGARVNLESDMLARTVMWLLERRGALPVRAPGEGSGVTEELLKRAGFM